MLKIKNSGIVWVWLALFVILIDRLSKIWIVNNLTLSDSLQILPILNFTLAHNTGAAFSMLHSAAGWQNVFLCTLAFTVCAAILYKLFVMPKSDRCIALSLSLILGGALGNVWDRIQYGYVIDFLHFHLQDWHFAIFNLADSAICVGAGLLLICWLGEGKG
jgi:signal peptidase II